MILGLGLFVSACDYKGTPVEYAQTCDKANDGQYVEVVGYFKNTGSAMCSKRGNEPMRCPVNFYDTPDQPKPIYSSIDLGSGASSIENVEGKGLIIRDINKEPVENTDKVKVTASVMVYSSPPSPDAKNAPCSLTVKKIEKIK